LLLFAAAILSVAESARADTLLRWKLKPGEKLRYSFQQESVTESSGTGKPTSVTVSMSMQLSWNVTAVDSQGVAAISQTIDKLSISMKVDSLAPLVYDSTAKTPASGPVKEIADVLAPLIAAPCTIRMTDRGEISDVELTPQLSQALEKTKSGALFSSGGVSRILRQAVVVLPENAIAANGTWESTRTLETPLGELKQVDRYTYVGSEQHQGRAAEKISVATSLAKNEGEPSKARPITLKETQQTGSLWFDNAAGCCLASQIDQALVTEQPYREMTIRVKTTTKSGMKMVAE
jgi:hypothetical protein